MGGIILDVLMTRCAGLDVHAETIVACVMIGEQDDELFIETETFPTLTKDLFRLLKWLENHGITHNCDGKYWDLLEARL